MDADLRRTGSSTSVAQSADGVVALSTFEVISDNKGYDGANTVSGTRFNFKLEDLAASITVVTREQIEDFAMLDTNDVFLYAASTEGTVTLTDFTVDSNGSVSDNVQLNRTQANRVRGLNSANISLGNFETMGRTPPDPLGLDSIEISRGPNTNVFGLGNPSGTVNGVAASANLTRDRSQVHFRADSYDGYRTDLDLNRVLKRHTRAVWQRRLPTRWLYSQALRRRYRALQRHNQIQVFQGYNSLCLALVFPHLLACQIGVSPELQNSIVQAFAAGTISSTQDDNAKGNEIELNFNPTRYGTVAASATNTQSINNDISHDIAQ